MRLIQVIVLAGLITANTALARADGMPIVPLPPPPIVYDGGPRTIYRDGNYFFCPYPEFDPYCQSAE